MRRRCTQESNDNYADYGGRGISYTERWDEFALFLEDMGDRPDGKTLDRIDSDGHYCKDNCRWATQREQLLNRRNTPMLTHDGKTLPLMDWSEVSAVPYKTLWHRVFTRNWDHSRAITEPAATKHRRKTNGL